ncbi:hypothetical protein AMECASPLE_011113 [Ameca splendens]|uniref:Uncharacterized protein n=1 Tax=Ameca splendens TaxID=208324 RepID=A0ABV0Y0L8_9TELE
MHDVSLDLQYTVSFNVCTSTMRVFVGQCSSRGSACCLSPYLEGDLICCNTAAQDTMKSHDQALPSPYGAQISCCRPCCICFSVAFLVGFIKNVDNRTVSDSVNRFSHLSYGFLQLLQTCYFSD